MAFGSIFKNQTWSATWIVLSHFDFKAGIDGLRNDRCEGHPRKLLKYVGNDDIDLSMAAVRISRQMSLQLKDMKELQSWSEISAEA